LQLPSREELLEILASKDSLRFTHQEGGLQESFELSPGEKKYKTMVTGFLSDVEALE
jgi:hypothetical protein